MLAGLDYDFLLDRLVKNDFKADCLLECSQRIYSSCQNFIIEYTRPDVVTCQELVKAFYRKALDIQVFLLPFDLTANQAVDLVGELIELKGEVRRTILHALKLRVNHRCQDCLFILCELHVELCHVDDVGLL
jgi:hypothetical protein